MAAAAGEFVDGWLVAGVLGEGAYGEVRLLVHGASGARVALKAVRGAAGAREAALHRALRHPHVLRCLGARAAGDAHYLFLEVAAGGELFERIEPDAGMAGAAARRYWRQLAAALRYLHARGVAHRDVKPENLLLTARDQLKLGDFGLATLFRHGVRERLLSRAAGTPPYAAPEVLSAAQRPYRAPPADTWAAAVVLVAMLAGELPWERAATEDARYAAWAAWATGASGPGPAGDSGPGPAGDLPAAAGPWRKLGARALQWCRRALLPAAADRDSLDQLLLHPYMCAGEGAETTTDQVDGRGWASQPAGGVAAAGGCEEEVPPRAMEALLSLSQPACADELWLSGGAGAGGVHLTRIAVRGDVSEHAAMQALHAAALEQRLQCRAAPDGSVLLCADDSGAVRVCARRAAGAGGGLVLQCRRARGCGLQYRRLFLRLRNALQHIAADTHTTTTTKDQRPHDMMDTHDRHTTD